MIKNIKSKNELSGFFVVYKGSTLIENKGTYGINHYLEHLLSKALDRYEDKFQIDAIEYNAYTSNNEVVFYITGLDNKVNKWKDKLISSLENIDDITEEEFELEKKVVLEEYFECFNSQLESHINNLNRKLFNFYTPIGLKDDIINFSYNDFKKYFKKYYSKPDLIINISKKHKYHNSKIEFNDKILLDKKYEYLTNNNFILENENEFNNKSSIIILSPVITEDFAYVKYINKMLNYGLSSPITKEIRVYNGLTYNISSSLDKYNETAINYTYTLTNNENVEKLINLYKNILINKDRYLTKKRFNTIKEYYKNKIKINKISNYRSISKYIDDSLNWNVDDIINDINFNKINEVYDKYFNIDNYYISVDKKEFI